MLNKAKYIIGGADYQLCPNFIIKNSTLREIIGDKDNDGYGEEKYQMLINLLVSTPYDQMVALHKQGIDYETVDKFDFFFNNFVSLPFGLAFQDSLITQENFVTFTEAQLDKILIDQTRILFGNIPIHKFVKTENIDTKEVGMYYCEKDKSGNIIFEIYIDKIRAGHLINYIREIHSMGEPDEKIFANKFVKEIYIEDETKRIERELKKKKEPISVYTNFLSVLINTPGFKYRYDDCMGLTVSQFYNAIKAFNLIDEYNLTMQGIYHGTVDPKKLKDESVLDLFQLKQKIT